MTQKWESTAVHTIPDDLLGLAVSWKEIEICPLLLEGFLRNYVDEGLILTTTSVPATDCSLNAGVQCLQ